MPAPTPSVAKGIEAQRDFSAGEIDASVKRADQVPEIARILKTGVRQASNVRIRNGGAIRNRPGRAALYLPDGAAKNVILRTDEITIAPGTVFRFQFSNGALEIYDTSGTVQFSQSGYGWTNATLPQITYGVILNAVYIACPGTQPQVLTWAGGNSWTSAAYAETVTAGGQKRTLFYRISPKNVTMQPSATVGAGITLTFSSAIAVAGMVGTRFRFCGRQILVTAFTNTSVLVGTVEEPLPPGQVITFSVDPSSLFNLSDVAIGQTSNAKGIVTAINAGAKTITVQLLQAIVSASASSPAAGAGGAPGGGGATISVGFISGEIVAGPGGSATVSGAPSTTTPQAVSVWDDEVMNSFRGFPGSVFVDQARLGFCNFPALPSAIAWSAISNPTDLYIDAPPSSAIFNLAPGKSQVFFVVPGPESSEFVFCNNAIYYIPITSTNPLTPSSVAFNLLSGEGAAQVQPRSVEQVIVYVNAGLTNIMAVVAPGAYYRPYEPRNLSELHSHLIKNPVAIAIPTATSTFEERYAYVLNNDGTMAVAKYSIQNGQIVGSVGWVPWNSPNGTVDWISARDSVVLFSTRYSPGITFVTVIEQLDDTRYLDGSVFVNNLPAALAAPMGKGPLWWLAGGNVDLMDQTTRMMGTYKIDANGNIIPQNNAGENLSAATLVAGQAWTATLEPFIPAVQPGQDQLQRMRKRRPSRAEIYVRNSSGFTLQTLYTEQQGRNLPAVGLSVRIRRIPAWNQDDDPTQPPPLRERAYAFKPTGRAHDPRLAYVKDTPGPWEVLETGFEVTV